MSESYRRQILNYLKNTTFPAITQAGGYNTNVQTVERGLQNLDSIGDDALPALFIGKTMEKRSNITRIQFKSVLNIFILGVVASVDGYSNAQEALDDMISDTTRAIEQDRTLGGLAKAVEVVGVVSDDGNMAPRAGSVLELEVTYVTEGVTP